MTSSLDPARGRSAKMKLAVFGTTGPGIGLSITAAAAARFLLAQATSAELLHSTPSISN